MTRDFGKQQEALADASNRLRKEERLHKEEALRFLVRCWKMFVSKQEEGCLV